MNGAKVLGFGFVAIIGAIVLAAIPRSEGYSSFGVGVVGNVDVECGSVFNRDQRVEFANAVEARQYNEEKSVFGEPSVFEGKTETEVCDDVLRAQQIISILLGVAGAAALLIGLLGGSLNGLLGSAPGAQSSTSGTQTGRGPPLQPDSARSPSDEPELVQPSTDARAMIDIDEPTARVVGLLEATRARVPVYVAPRLFLAGSVAYLVATLQNEHHFWLWGSVNYLKGIILITAIAAAAGFRCSGRYADLVAAIGSAYLVGDGLWRLVAGLGPVWIRLMLTLADLMLVAGLIQYLDKHGPPPSRAGARPDHARTVLIGCGVVTFVVLILGAQRNYGGGFTELVYVFGFWGLCTAALTVALLIRSRDMLVFATGLAALRFIHLFAGRYGGSSAWAILSKIGFAAVASFAAWQWYVDRQLAAELASSVSVADSPPSGSPTLQPSAPVNITSGEGNPGRPTARTAEAARVFSADAWSTEDFRTVVERLDERGVIFEIEDGKLFVDPAAGPVTEFIVDEVISPGI